MDNHIATTADFRAAQELGRGQPERVILPKLGKAIIMRRPTPAWFIFRGQFPATLAARPLRQGGSAASGGDGELKDQNDMQRFAGWVVELLDEVMIQPRVSLAPGPGEISPDLIDDEDLTFIIKWSMGVVAPDGRGLDEFRSESKPAATGASS